MSPVLPIVLLVGAILASKNAKTNRGQQNVLGAGQTIPAGLGTSGFASISQQDMQMIQHDLAWLGYFHGPMHGTYDEATASALESFQEDHGLHPADGLPGRETLETLERVMQNQP